MKLGLNRLDDGVNVAFIDSNTITKVACLYGAYVASEFPPKQLPRKQAVNLLIDPLLVGGNVTCSIGSLFRYHR